MTIVEFGDFERPYGRSTAPMLRALVDTSDGAVRLVFRHVPLFEVHPHARTSALAAEAAAVGGLFWEMHDLLLRGTWPTTTCRTMPRISAGGGGARGSTSPRPSRAPRRPLG